ncbi:hypothetical protein FOA52_014041 [Chlamydomonas sp. UWO 241]|nr:hypothetical protein FOA52_014041 [Chlamydomonas sp. UWO 241]
MMSSISNAAYVAPGAAYSSGAAIHMPASGGIAASAANLIPQSSSFSPPLLLPTLRTPAYVARGAANSSGAAILMPASGGIAAGAANLTPQSLVKLSFSTPLLLPTLAVTAKRALIPIAAGAAKLIPQSSSFFTPLLLGEAGLSTLALTPVHAPTPMACDVHSPITPPVAQPRRGLRNQCKAALDAKAAAELEATAEAEAQLVQRMKRHVMYVRGDGTPSTVTSEVMDAAEVLMDIIANTASVGSATCSGGGTSADTGGGATTAMLTDASGDKRGRTLADSSGDDDEQRPAPAPAHKRPHTVPMRAAMASVQAVLLPAATSARAFSSASVPPKPFVPADEFVSRILIFFTKLSSPSTPGKAVRDEFNNDATISKALTYMLKHGGMVKRYSSCRNGGKRDPYMYSLTDAGKAAAAVALSEAPPEVATKAQAARAKVQASKAKTQAAQTAARAGR